MGKYFFCLPAGGYYRQVGTAWYKDRKFTASTAIRRQERSYSDEKKEEVIMWLIHHRVQRLGEWKPPSLRDAEKHFKIPKSTIADWNEFRESHISNQQRRYASQWPDLEERLYNLFLERREKQQIVTTAWFRLKARLAFRELYPDVPWPFPFSYGWWRGFLRRHNIVKRRVTKQSSRRPEDYINVVNNFLRFIRRVSQKRGQSRNIARILNSPKRRFPKWLILNLDETPIPFEFLDGCTWEIQGARTVAGKTDRSGWNKRQATLVLYIFADGIHRLKPKLIFHGVPTEEGGQIFEKEAHLYSPDVTVEYNKTAYNNEDLFSRWIKEELSPLCSDDSDDFLLVMDAAAFHKTPSIKEELKSYNITLALIPGGCTALLQPLDTAINGPFKRWLQEATDEYMERIEREKGPDYQWTVGDKRVMVTHVVAAALRRLNSNPDLVKKAFLNCGISVRPDGSEDCFISIKDISADQIDFTGWENAEEVVVKDEDPVDPFFDDQELISADDSELMIITRYHEQVMARLREILKERGLKVSGKKADLIQRLQDHDNSQRSARRGESCDSQISQVQDVIEVIPLDN
jgi:hypothetical protein